MICSCCGGDRFDQLVRSGPYASYRLTVTTCCNCGGGEASGFTRDGRPVYLVRDPLAGEERVTIGGVTRVRALSRSDPLPPSATLPQMLDERAEAIGDAT